VERAENLTVILPLTIEALPLSGEGGLKLAGGHTEVRELCGCLGVAGGNAPQGLILGIDNTLGLQQGYPYPSGLCKGGGQSLVKASQLRGVGHCIRQAGFNGRQIGLEVLGDYQMHLTLFGEISN
jgi:hypothetical protein